SVGLMADFFLSKCLGLLADAIGRKRSFGIAGILDLIGSLIQLLARKYWVFVLGRIIASFSVGILCSLVPLCKDCLFCRDANVVTQGVDQSEVSVPSVRGRLITLHQLGITLGFCAAFWIGYDSYQYTFEKAWRISIGLQLVPAVALLGGLAFIPESPRWLLYMDRNDEAHAILKRLRGLKDESVEHTVQMEYTRILENVGYDRQCDAQGVGLWSKGVENNARRTLLGIGIQSASQFSGISALHTIGLLFTVLVFFYASISTLLHIIIIILFYFFTEYQITFFFFFLYQKVDRLGRRKILIYGGVAMGLCVIVVAIITGLETEITDDSTDSESLGVLVGFTMSSINRKASIAIVSLLMVFIAIHAASFGTLAWVYPAEIYTQLIRAKAIGITVAANFCVQIFIIEIAPLMFLNILWGTYIVFGCFCFLISLLIYQFYPETRVRDIWIYNHRPCVSIC
ncbi:hypothetical protein CLU79DRAFT_713261, partial [Phycomyces nitens]